MKWGVHQSGGLSLAVAENGAGESVYFQHGLCGSIDQTMEVFPPNAGWRITTLECRGHGRSPPGNESAFSIETFADDLVTLIEQTSNRPVVIGGISMGAAIAMKIAAARPELVRGLMIARPAWLISKAPPNMRPTAVVGDYLLRLGAKEGLSQFEKSELADQLARDAPDNLASLKGFFSREPIAVTGELLVRISNDGPGITERALASIKSPTLIIGTGRDAIHPLALAQRMAEILPAARLVEITSKADSRGRYIDEFKIALADFLEELKQ